MRVQGGRGRVFQSLFFLALRFFLAPSFNMQRASALGARPTLRPAGTSRRHAVMPHRQAAPARPGLAPPARRSVAPAAVSTSSAAAKKTQPMPFVKLADQEEMKLALLLNVVDPAVGGVLIMGDRGTGKSVAVSVENETREQRATKEGEARGKRAHASRAWHAEASSSKLDGELGLAGRHTARAHADWRASELAVGRSLPTRPSPSFSFRPSLFIFRSAPSPSCCPTWMSSPATPSSPRPRTQS